MRDNALIALIIATILAQEVIAGIQNLPLQQAFQPTQQGTDATPTAFLFKIGDSRRGTPEVSDVWDAGSSRMVHTEAQLYDTTFQMSALSIQDPSNASQLTASDICNLVASILQSSETVKAFQAQNIGILRIGDVRNPYFMDDFGRFEAQPSFDFTISHTQTLVTYGPVIDHTEFNLLPV